ncbi:MAG TPA: OB-fold nucleic acid binding domain-containing protein, partial [Candidatus Binatia bacterium]|nr:OB-fold nucleic acid binding domain-containing protein [Candidatus Binatia bacterium]
AYGVISYQTAYLKAHYPVEFMAGLLSNEINNTEKISVFVGECRRMGISILPPDINKSGLKFTPETVAEDTDGRAQGDGAQRAALQQNAIRYGLAAIKHVGEAAMETAIREREQRGDFTSLEDLCTRLDSRVANRKMLESLIKAGAFDFLGRDRSELFSCIDDAVMASAAAQRDRLAGQVSLFDEATAPTGSRKRQATPWSDHEKLSYEKELLGFYVSGHPLDAYADIFAAKNYRSIASLGGLDDRAPFKIAGAIVEVEKKFTRKEGKPFAVVWIEDRADMLEVVVWNEVYLKAAAALVAGRVIEIRGTLDKRDEIPRAVAQEIGTLSPRKPNGAEGSTDKESVVLLQFSPATTGDELREVRRILASSPGRRPVRLLFDRASGNALRLDAGTEFSVNLTRDLEEKLSRWLVTGQP